MEVRRLRAQNKERTAVPRPRHGGIHQLINLWTTQRPKIFRFKSLNLFQ